MQQLKDHPFFQSQRNLKQRNLFSRENIMEMRKRNRSAYERKQPTLQSLTSVPKLQVMRLETRPDNRSQILPNSKESNRKIHSSANHKSLNLMHQSQRPSQQKATQVKNKKSEFIACGFRPKLLKKSLQDNPLILGSILKKKLRVMQRQELDRYLTSVIKPPKQ